MRSKILLTTITSALVLTVALSSRRVPLHLTWESLVGVPLLWGINAVGEWAQHQWFPATWEADRHVNEAIASVLDRRGMVVLSLSAGIGEEITIRGALQPKLGLVLTSLFFAALHVQSRPPR